jgi:hypothetical protein
MKKNPKSFIPNLDRLNYLWSQRDWEIYKALHTGGTKHQKEVTLKIVTAYRSGESVTSIKEKNKISKQYIYKILAIQKLRDNKKMEIFYSKRKNLGRPLDLGGKRNEWIED